MRRKCALLLIVVVAGSRANAQVDANTGRDSAATPRRAKTEATLSAFTRKDLILTGSFLVGAASAAALDAEWGGRLQTPKVQGRALFRSVAKGAEILGDPGALIVTSAMYAGGRLLHRRGLADAGLHAAESVVLSGAFTTVLKGVVGRARPNTPNSDPGEIGPDADRFRFAGGFSGEGYTSFPSGHTTVAFAAASAFTQELSESHPRAARVVGPILYGGATAVGLSRMYDNKHWASDVIVGAGVGTLVGRAVVKNQHAHRDTWLNRLLLPNVIAPGGSGGVALGWSLTTR